TKIIVQHHAEQARQGVMARLQHVADKYVDAYLFATKELAEPWVDQGIIKKEKVFQVMEGSSDLPQLDKHTARHHLQLSPGPVFLWVGSLSERKDPLTVLRGFAQYLRQQPLAALYMIYQQDELLQPVQEIIAADERLRNSVFLKGKMEKKDLAYWYNAADFFIAGSHREGSGYALIEAMSCGCIPVVTDIPSFRQITDHGNVGILFNKGDADSLLQMLRRIDNMPVRKLSMQVKEQFQKELSFKAIAGQLYKVCEQLGCKL
ncbi:MAG TPA: glycosyltransferase family 4 protein, partial [Chitinophagaceae bacterium]